MIHPDALSLINRERFDYHMVQVPVLPMPTALSKSPMASTATSSPNFRPSTCTPANIRSHSFLPTVSEPALRATFSTNSPRNAAKIFDAASLTEDYEIGVYIHASKFKQKFAPLTQSDGESPPANTFRIPSAPPFVSEPAGSPASPCNAGSGAAGEATGEQNTGSGATERACSPVRSACSQTSCSSPALIDWFISVIQHRPWLSPSIIRRLIVLSLLTTVLQCFRIVVRMICVHRIFGLMFALGVPFRIFHGNLINCSPHCVRCGVISSPAARAAPTSGSRPITPIQIEMLWSNSAANWATCCFSRVSSQQEQLDAISPAASAGWRSRQICSSC